MTCRHHHPASTSPANPNWPTRAARRAPTSTRYRLAALLLASALSAPVAAQETGYLNVGAGAFDFSETEALSALGVLQYFGGERIWGGGEGSFFRGFGPTAGLYANTDGGVFGYGGFFFDLRLSERWTLLPQAGFGGYAEGDSKHLGGVFQTHSGFGLYYRLPGNALLPEDARIGVTAVHMSNAGTSALNPGANSIYASVSFPLPAGW